MTDVGQGYLWMRVCTPQVFEEYRIAIECSERTPEERRNYERLQDVAERCRTSILCGYKRVG